VETLFHKVWIENVSSSTLVLDLPLAGPTVLFSSSTLRYFVPDPVADALRLLTTSVLWLFLGYGVWHSIQRIIKPRH